MKRASSSKTTISSIILLVPCLLFGKLQSDLQELRPHRAVIDSLLMLSDQSLDLVAANAHMYASKALQLAYRLQFDSGIFEARQQLGKVELKRGQYNRAIHWFTKNLESAREWGQPEREACALHQLGWGLLSAGGYTEAIDRMNAAMQIYKTIESDPVSAGQITCMSDLAYAWQLAGESGKALDYYQQAKGIAVEQDLQQELPRLFNRIGDFYQSDDNLDSARSYYHMAYFFSTHHRIEKARIESLHNIADNSLAREKYELSRGEAKKVLRLAEGDQYLPDQLAALELIAQTSYHLGEYDTAAVYYSKYVSMDHLEKQDQLATLQGVADELYEEKLELEENGNTLRRILAGVVGVILILGAVVILILLRLRKRIQAIHFIEENHQRASEQDLETYVQQVLEKNRMIEVLNNSVSLHRSIPDIHERSFQPVLLAGEEWDRFRRKFDQVYPGFSVEVKTRKNTLLARVLTLRHLALDSKDIALLLGMTHEAIMEVLAGNFVYPAPVEPRKIMIS